MPKLLIRSKHEEFESDLALQIRDEKERRAENAENLELQEILTRTIHAHGTVHPTMFHPAARFAFCLFWFLPNLSLVMDFHFVFFLISHTLSTCLSLSQAL